MSENRENEQNEVIQVKIKKIDGYDDVTLPERKTEGASCYDIYAHSVEKKEKGLYKIGFGFATEIPPGYQAKIYPRSSISTKGWMLANSIGVIDSDYRGEWKAYFRPISFNEFPYEKGDRVAQFEITPVLESNLNEVNELSSTERDDGGFGSTGS